MKRNECSQGDRGCRGSGPLRPDRRPIDERGGGQLRGDIIGYGHHEGFRQRALYWPASEPDTVHVLEGSDLSTVAVDISDGVILGRWDAADPSERGGYLWEDPQRKRKAAARLYR